MGPINELERIANDPNASARSRDSARAEVNRLRYIEGEADAKSAAAARHSPDMWGGLLTPGDFSGGFYGKVALVLILVFALSLLSTLFPAPVSTLVPVVANVIIFGTIAVLVLLKLLRFLLRLFFVGLIFFALILLYMYLYPNG